METEVLYIVVLHMRQELIHVEVDQLTENSVTGLFLGNSREVDRVAVVHISGEDHALALGLKAKSIGGVIPRLKMLCGDSSDLEHTVIVEGAGLVGMEADPVLVPLVIVEGCLDEGTETIEGLLLGEIGIEGAVLIVP